MGALLPGCWRHRAQQGCGGHLCGRVELGSCVAFPDSFALGMLWAAVSSQPFLSFLQLYLVFETRSHCGLLGGLELTVYPRQTFNSWQCFAAVYQALGFQVCATTLTFSKTFLMLFALQLLYLSLRELRTIPSVSLGLCRSPRNPGRETLPLDGFSY